MFKLQQQHLEVLTEFMEENPEFAKGRLSISNAREKFKTLWVDLTTKLNFLGLGEKPIEKWQKTWSDYKSNLKKKAAEIKRHQEGTGRGPPSQKSLTDLELRILNILGTIFYAGVGVEEIGLNVGTGRTATASSSANVDQAQPESQPSTSGIKRVSKTSENMVKTRQENDHDYWFYDRQNEPPPKKRKNKAAIEAYEETIECLRSIENTVRVGLSEINNTLKEGFQSLNNQNRAHYDYL